MKLRALILVAALAGAGSAYAQPPGGGGGPDVQAARDAMMKACAADLTTLCPGLTGRDANMCLRQNSAKVSPDCQTAMSKVPGRPPGPPAN